MNASPDEYISKNKFILRMWSWIGSTTHMVALIICSIFNRIDLYLIYTVTLGNVVMILLKIRQDRIIKDFSGNIKS